MIYLSLGSNVGNRLQNLRLAVEKLSNIIAVKKLSIIFETEAILPEKAPNTWDMPYLNMVVCGDTDLNPEDLFDNIKYVEHEIGGERSKEKWAPRIIDIDILFYDDISMKTEKLTIPHTEIENRDFMQVLLNSVGFDYNTDRSNNFTPLNSFVLYPKLVGIVNVTPDSFSEGGMFFEEGSAIRHANFLYNNGATIVEFGAQSTRPGYKEIPPRDEISRLSKIFERSKNMNNLGIDSYFDEVIQFAIKKHNIKWINDINGKISVETIKLIADSKAKLVTMLHGTDINYLKERVKYLVNSGMHKDDIILDPGIGFGKTKYENKKMIETLDVIKNMGCEIMLGHSRKSFISNFSNATAPERDIETLAISEYARLLDIDYLRVHAVKSHMKFFSAKCMFNL